MSTKHSSDNRERRGALFLDACRGRARRLIAARPRRDHGGDPGAAGQSAHAAVDEQQALLIAALSRAHGEPVSYQELRDAGIEYPASVVSELELAGLPLERCYEGPLAERRLLGVRLEAHDGPEDTPRRRPRRASVEQMPTPVADRLERAVAELDVFSAIRALERRARRALAWLSAQAPVAARTARQAGEVLAAMLRALWELAREAAARWRRTRGDRARQPPAPGARAPAGRRRWLAPAALIAAGAVVAALLIGALAGSGRGDRAPAHRAPHVSSRGAARHASTSRQPAAPTPVSPALAAQLEARGHAMLEAGQAERAVPVLQQALSATGESLSGCVSPVSETCLSYAYALFDLGRALRLDHQPAAAALILERRLQIANQRAVVQSELQLARQEAARPTPIASASG